VYALGIGGQSGVEDLIRYYKAELELNMSLSSVRAVSDLDHHIFERS
jgi:isopentenyl diphosphate isomerase/L-lactate dehydrogenase-like FMN-dependent dehydrogenase